MPEKVFVRNIPDELWRAMKAKAALEGITVSEAVQRAFKQYLGILESQLPASRAFEGIVGLFSSGRSENCERNDQHLAEGEIEKKKSKPEKTRPKRRRE